MLSAVALCAPSGAAEYSVADGKLTVTASAYLGTAIRTANRDPKLLADADSSVLGIAGQSASPSAGRNMDDGNLNFARGDAVASVLKAYVALDYRWRNFGIEASGQGWYDYATADAHHPWGNERNGYSDDSPLGDSGALARSRFSGFTLDNLNVYGHHARDSLTWDWRLGYQVLDWGKRMVVMGGLRELNPIDIPASLRPGALREQESRIGIPALHGRVAWSNATSLEAFYQFAFEPSAPNQCGSFWSLLDFMAEHCKKAMFGNLSDRDALTTGIYVKRTPTVDPNDSGQGGLALKHTFAALSTEVGLYAAQFHSRTIYYSGTKSGRSGAPFIPGDPDGLNPTYFTEYPERIRIFGATFDTKLRAGAVFGELTYRPNHPLQYNSTDVMAAAVSLTAPTPLRDRLQALPPGGIFHAFQRHESLQLQLAGGTQLPDVLGSAGLNLGVELVYKSILDLPDPAVERYGRAEAFGQGPVDGVCPPPAKPVSCTFDGYVSRNAYGYRLRAGLRYPDVGHGVELSPTLFFGHDVAGWSGDGLILEGRLLANLTLQAKFATHWTSAISWQPTWGGRYNPMRDRSTAQVYVGYQF
jgi:hypothetical protein